MTSYLNGIDDENVQNILKSPKHLIRKQIQNLLEKINSEVNTQTTATFTVTERNTIICSQCNFEQPISQKVCWRCGAKFEQT